MVMTATPPRVCCLSCGTPPATDAAAPVNLRSQSERFAFAHCPHCNCLRMMSVERSAARKPHLVATALSAS